VPDRRRHEPANVLHQEELGAEGLDVTEELPEKHPAEVGDSPSPAGSAERLAWRTTSEQVELSRSQREVVHDLMGVDPGDVALVDAHAGV